MSRRSRPTPKPTPGQWVDANLFSAFFTALVLHHAHAASSFAGASGANSHARPSTHACSCCALVPTLVLLVLLAHANAAGVAPAASSSWSAASAASAAASLSFASSRVLPIARQARQGGSVTVRHLEVLPPPNASQLRRTCVRTQPFSSPRLCSKSTTSPRLCSNATCCRWAATDSSAPGPTRLLFNLKLSMSLASHRGVTTEGERQGQGGRD